MPADPDSAPPIAADDPTGPLAEGNAPPIAANPEDEPRWYLAADGTLQFLSDYNPFGDWPRSDPWDQSQYRVYEGNPRGEPDEVEDFPWSAPFAHPRLVPIPRPLIRRVMRGMIERKLLADEGSENAFLRSAGKAKFPYSPTLAEYLGALKAGRDRMLAIHRAASREQIEKASPEQNNFITVALKESQSRVEKGYRCALNRIIVWAKLLLEVPLTRRQIRGWKREFHSGLQCSIGHRTATYPEICALYLPHAREAPEGLAKVFQAARPGFEDDLAAARDEIAKLRNPSGELAALELGIEAEHHIAGRLRIAGVPEYDGPAGGVGSDGFDPPSGTPDLLALTEMPPDARRACGAPNDLRRILAPKPDQGAEGVREILDRSRVDARVWDHIAVDWKRTPHLNWLSAWWHGRSCRSFDEEERLALVILLSLLQNWWEPKGRTAAGLKALAGPPGLDAELPPSQAADGVLPMPEPVRKGEKGRWLWPPNETLLADLLAVEANTARLRRENRCYAEVPERTLREKNEVLIEWAKECVRRLCLRTMNEFSKKETDRARAVLMATATLFENQDELTKLATPGEILCMRFLDANKIDPKTLMPTGRALRGSIPTEGGRIHRRQAEDD